MDFKERNTINSKKIINFLLQYSAVVDINVTGLFRALANSRADDSDDGTVSYEDK